MKRMSMLWIIYITIFFPITAGAQALEPHNHLAPKQNIESRKATPYPTIREADIMWQRRVWRVIDLREKMNQFFYYPLEPTNGRKNFITIIMDAILKDKVVAAYDPLYDDFKVKMSLTEVAGIGNDTIIRIVQDPEPPYPEREQMFINPLDYSTIKKIKVKEDWFFDKQRSVMEVRIVAICPVRERLDPQTGEFRGYSDMFWIYFPELRHVLAKQEAYNRFSNMAQLISYDDIFMKRLFASYIMKEDNVYDRRIEDYLKNGLDALLESEDIKDKIRNFEHDLWEQ